MRGRICGLLLGALLLGCGSAAAIGTFGEINSYMDYADLRIVRGSRPRVCGTIENKTAKRLQLSADILFKNRSDLLNKAKVQLKIQPDGKNAFCEYLDHTNAEATERALFVEWDLYRFKVNDATVISREATY